jgi:hypothetical protein
VSVTNDDTNTFVTNLTTDSTGTYSGNLGGNANYSVEVVEAPGFNLDNYDQRDTEEGLEILSGDSGRIDVRLDEVLNPNDLQVTDTTPSDATASADNSSEITVELTVFDQNGDGLGGQDVNIDTGSSTIYVNGSSTVTSASDGTVEFTVFSNETQTQDLTFDVTGTSLEETREVSFNPTFLDAENGVIAGSVGNVDQDNEEGATVYAVSEDRTSRNEYEINLNFSNVTGDTASFRIQNTSSGELIDSDRYDVTFADTNADTNFTLESDVRPLNTSDSAAGNGFTITNESVGSSPLVNATVLMVEPGNYTLQEADGASPADGDFTDRTTFEASAELTLEDAENRVENSDQNLVDTSDEDGDFRLTKLNTNGDDGRDYLIIAQKAGLSTEFTGPRTVDPDEANLQLDVVLQPRDAPPVDSVDITNVGTADTDGGEYSAPDRWDSTNDSYAQDVPRDGTYDVIEVRTFVDSTDENGNGTVTLEVRDDSSVEGDFDVLPSRAFDGEFTSVDNGTEVSTGEDTITITTGDDGIARVYLQTDNSNVDLNGSAFNTTAETGIEARLSGGSASDFTNKSFVGVTEFTTGSISGLVTDENNEPLEGSNLFVSGIDTDEDGTDEFSITRNVNETTGNVTFEVSRQSTGVSENVSASELQSYEFGAFSDVGTTAPVTLFTGDVSASYTLSDVPADDSGVALTISGVANEVIGNSVPGTVTTDSTGSANVQINTVLNPDFQLSLVDGPTTITQGESFTATLEVSNDGTGAGTQDITYVLEDANGDSTGIEATEEDVSLDAGDSSEITFSVTASQTSGLATGNTTHVFGSGDDELTVDAEVVEGTGSPLSGTAGEFDTNGDGIITATELGDAGTAFAQGNLNATELGEVGTAFAQS